MELKLMALNFGNSKPGGTQARDIATSGVQHNLPRQLLLMDSKLYAPLDSAMRHIGESAGVSRAFKLAVTSDLLEHLIKTGAISLNSNHKYKIIFCTDENTSPTDDIRFAVLGGSVLYSAKSPSSKAAKNALAHTPVSPAAPVSRGSEMSIEKLMAETYACKADLKTMDPAHKDFQTRLDMFDGDYLLPFAKLAASLAFRDKVGSAIWALIYDSAAGDRSVVDGALAKAEGLWRDLCAARQLHKRNLPPDTSTPGLMRHLQANSEILGAIDRLLGKETPNLKRNREEMLKMMQTYTRVLWPLEGKTLSNLLANFSTPTAKALHAYSLFETQNLHTPSLELSRQERLELLIEATRLIDYNLQKHGETAVTQSKTMEKAAFVLDQLITRMGEFELALAELYKRAHAAERMQRQGQKAAESSESSEAECLCNVMQIRSGLLVQLHSLYKLFSENMRVRGDVELALTCIEDLFENLCQGPVAGRKTLLDGLLKSLKTPEKAPKKASKSVKKQAEAAAFEAKKLRGVLEQYLVHVGQIGKINKREKRKMPPELDNGAKNAQKELEHCIGNLPPILKAHFEDLLFIRYYPRHSRYKQNLPPTTNLMDWATPEGLLLTLYRLSLEAKETGKSSNVLINRRILQDVLKETSLLNLPPLPQFFNTPVLVPIQDAEPEIMALLETLMAANVQIYGLLKRPLPGTKKSILTDEWNYILDNECYIEHSIPDIQLARFFNTEPERELYVKVSETPNPDGTIAVTLTHAAFDNTNSKSSLLSKPLTFIRDIVESPLVSSGPPQSLEDEIFGPKLDISGRLDDYASLFAALLESMPDAVKLNSMFWKNPGPFIFADAMNDLRPGQGAMALARNQRGELVIMNKLPPILKEFGLGPEHDSTKLKPPVSLSYIPREDIEAYKRFTALCAVIGRLNLLLDKNMGGYIAIQHQLMTEGYEFLKKK
ncbi:MAG: hypothetical protein Q7T16_04430 [Candidatus Burarchaeum sp.]|nr:hypothetical protein [Candidatus Burarchaeum sp.]MDO8339875.1 hypothetical protein [Candidatus Burarchaeum sp.]